jgi:MFS family permease
VDAVGVLEPFRERSFALYFAGQVTSNTGTWFQNLALQLVVLGSTGSAQALGGVTVAQFLPLLLLSIPAGRLADRVRPRTILLVTSASAAVVAASLALAVRDADPDLPLIYALIALLGTVQAFERIAAQTIVFELVGPARLASAASISTIALATARSIGPGLAGLAFQALGAPWCMLLNAASFVAVFASLMLIRPASLHPRVVRTDRPAVAIGSLWRRRDVGTLLIVNVVVALLAMNLGLVLTSATSLTHGGDAAAVGAVHALNAVGAVVGGLIAAALPVVAVRSLALGATAFGASLAVEAAAPELWLFLLAAPLLGLGLGYYQGVLHAAAQASVPPEAIGRLMSLVTLGSYGMVPFGALIMGAVIDASSARVAIGIAAAAVLLCGAFVAFRTRRGLDPSTEYQPD